MAKFHEWSPALEQALAEPFPPALIQQMSKGRTSISFVPWHAYAARLNDLVGPGWSVGELSMREVGGKLVTALPLTILGTTRVNVGTEDEGKDDFGDAATNSWAQAFKRTCALFGLGLSMYDKTGAVAKVREAEARAIPRLGGTGPYRDTPLVDVPDAVLVEARDALAEAAAKSPLKQGHADKLVAIQAVLTDRDALAAAALPAQYGATP